MADVYWIGNAQKRSQVITCTVTAVALSGTVTATLNTNAITYTCTASDTVSTAASALQALLAATVCPEFALATYTVSGAVITATAANPGEPFSGMTNGLTFSAAAGATVTQATVTSNSSPSDVANTLNWLRAGANALPQAGDRIILQDSSVPLLWNLTALVAIAAASFQRWQSHTGQIGLPPQNPAGFREFRPTRFQFIGSGTLVLSLGLGSGSGPSLERYDNVGQRVDLFASGGGVIDWISTNAANTVRVENCTLNVASDLAEVATIETGIGDGGGAINLGEGVTLNGTLTLNNTQATLACAGSFAASNGSQVTVTSRGATHAAISARGSYVNWLSNSTITALTMTDGSTLDKSGDARAVTITNATIDGDCTILDPNSVITYTNPVTVLGQVTAGPFQFAGSRTVAIV